MRVPPRSGKARLPVPNPRPGTHDLPASLYPSRRYPCQPRGADASLVAWVAAGGKVRARAGIRIVR
jgi:hypothetical protein